MSQHKNNTVHSIMKITLVFGQIMCMDDNADGLCGDVLLDIGIIGYGMASKLLGKVVQTN